MDPKRRKIYIILIVACVVLSAVILAWNFFSTPSAPAPAVLTGDNSAANAAAPIDTGAGAGGTTSFGSPNVFPASSTFDTQVLQSTGFKALNTYTPLDTTGQIGRDNPFKGY